MSLILGIATTLSAPFRMVVGYLADRLQAREVVFAIMALLTALFHLSLYFTPTEESPTLIHNDYSTLVGMCSNSRRFTLEAFNETVSIMINSSSYKRTDVRCCFDGSTCFDMSYSGGDIKYLLVNNLSDVEHWFTSRNVPLEDQPHCIDLQNCNRTTTIELKPFDNRKTFWTFFVLYLFAQATFSPLLSLLDSLIYISLTKVGKPKEFGKSCLWGVLGFGLFAFVSGAIQDYLKQQGRESRETYVFTFAMFCLGMVLVAVIAIATRSSVEVSKTVNAKAIESNLTADERNSVESEIKPLNDESNVKSSIFQDTKEMVAILCGFYIFIIIVTAMISGMLAGCLEGFFYYFLASLDPNNKLVLGACLAVSSICEAIVLFFSGRILSLIGPKNSLYLVFVVFAIRFVSSSYLENPWYGLLVDAIQCISFGLVYPVMTSWASSLVPSKFQSTVLCYVGAVYFSLGKNSNRLIYVQFNLRLIF